MKIRPILDKSMLLAATWVVAMQAHAVVPTLSSGPNGSFTLLLESGGTVKATGANTYGQLGDGTTVSKSAFVTVSNLANISAVSAGTDFGLAISNGFVYAWGRGANGRLGNGYTTNCTKPVQVMITTTDPLSNIVAIAAGGDFALALQKDANYPKGRIWSWGNNASGQLGDDTYTSHSRPAFIDHGLIDSYNLDLDLIAAGPSTGATASSTDGYNSVLLWGDAPANGDDSTDQVNSCVPWSPPFVSDEFYSFTPCLKKIVISANFGMVLTTNGNVYGWGVNSSGQLASDNTQNQYLWTVSHPSQLGEVQANISNVVDIAAGNGHVIAVLSNGEAWGWGTGSFGRTGNGTTSGGRTPIQVSQTGNGAGLTNIVSVTAGWDHSVALSTNSVLGCYEVMGWGHHDDGQIGCGKFDWRGYPETVSNITTAANSSLAVTADGNRTYVLLADETVAAWGANVSGYLGNGGNQDEPLPIKVIHQSAAELTNITAIEAGGNHTLAISNGFLWSWGINTSGQLGNGTTSTKKYATLGDYGFWSYYSDPTAVTNLLAVSAGTDHSLAIGVASNVVWAWGRNLYGQIGRGENGSYPYAHPVLDETGNRLSGFNLISAGANHNLAVSNGIVWAWGQGASGRLGINSTTNKTNAVPVTSLSGVTAIAAGNTFSLALSNDWLYAWGENGSGQLGINSAVDKWVPTIVTNGFVAIAAGDDFAIAIRTNEFQGPPLVYTWGVNDRGQLGLGDKTLRRVPTLVTNLTDVVAVAAGANHAIAVKSNGTVVSWGDTTDGQHGDGNVGFKKVPTPAVTTP